jgi:PAS domain S-box-containing protein
MPEFFYKLFDTDFMPHAFCLRAPELIKLHAASDGLIALSYFLIPAALIMLVRRRRDLAFRWAFALFGVFILACGTTHALSIVTLWHPVYRLEGMVKAITALASIGTAALLLRLVPLAAALPSPTELRREVNERRHAEEELEKLNVDLEDRVRRRTSELESANAKLAELAATLDKTTTFIQKMDGTILYWNSGVESMVGWSPEEAMGRKAHELLGAELPRPYSEIQDELLKGGSWRGEFRQCRRDGSSMWVTSHWALHRDARGEPLSVVKPLAFFVIGSRYPLPRKTFRRIIAMGKKRFL